MIFRWKECDIEQYPIPQSEDRMEFLWFCRCWRTVYDTKVDALKAEILNIILH